MICEAVILKDAGLHRLMTNQVATCKICQEQARLYYRPGLPWKSLNHWIPGENMRVEVFIIERKIAVSL